MQLLVVGLLFLGTCQYLFAATPTRVTDEGTDESLGEKYYQRAVQEAAGSNRSEWGKSFESLLLAAHHGHPRAQHSLAAAYSAGLYQGMRIPMDPGRYDPW